MMKQTRPWAYILTLLAVLTVTSCGKLSKEQKEKNNQLIEAAHKQKDYNRLLQLADSMEAANGISQAKACYWRGYAYDHLKQRKEAEDNWRKSMEAALASNSEDDQQMYAKSASYLANMFCMERDFQSALQLAAPVVQKLQEQKRDTTSNYINLLIYVGLSRVGLGTDEKEAEGNFELALKKHQENIKRHRTDAAYKDAIAGLINISYHCVRVGKYQEALYYTRNFGELLAEYEQRPGVDAAYIDKQVGRYTIYKTQAQKKLGQEKEAATTYEAFLATNFSKSAEAKKLIEEYQIQ